MAGLCEAGFPDRGQRPQPQYLVAKLECRYPTSTPPSPMPMIARFAQSLWMFSILLANVASGQVADTAADPFRKYGDTVAVKYRVGASIEANRGGVRDIVATVAVPFECDEQEVIVTDEDISPEIDKVDYRIIDGGARQMVITIPELPDGTEAHATLTFEVRTKAVLTDR